MSAADHPGRDQLFAFLVGTLPEEAEARVYGHISSCEACQAVLKSLNDAEDTLTVRLRQRVPEHACLAEPECQAAVARAAAILGDQAVAGTRSFTDTTTELGDGGRLGEYRLLEKLGEGGMGTVYKALHTRLDRLVALKVLPKDRMADDRAIARFEREMKAVGRLKHPNIVEAHDARQIDDVTVLVMEYVDGLDLSKLVSLCGPLPIADACELARQTALGLEYAHQQGLVHRDIKPSNLMLSVVSGQLSVVAGHGQLTTDHGQPTIVKILDLGLALLSTGQPVGEEMTASGQPMGTAEYMAPEQVSDSHSVDIRADIYSLGCTLYKLLTGQAPFSARKPKGRFDIMLAHVSEPVPPLRERRPDAPDQLAALVDRMLAKDPAQRPATPAEVAAALHPLCVDCDLAQLLLQARRAQDSARSAEEGQRSTDEYLTSPAVGTHPGQPSDVRPAPFAVRRRLHLLAIAAGLLFVAAGILLAVQIKIRIRDKEGRETVIAPPPGAEVVVEQDAKEVFKLSQQPAPTQPQSAQTETRNPESQPQLKPLKIGPPVPRPKPIEIDLKPEPLDLPPGAPMSRMALVSNPASIPGVRSWTIETIGHRGYCEYLAYSLDGDRMATCCWDDVIRLWDAKTGQFLRALVGHNAPIEQVCWSPVGNFLASASRDHTVRVWDAQTGAPLLTFHSDDRFLSIAWSPDGRYLAAGTLPPANSIHLWEIMVGRKSGDLQGSAPREGWRLMAPGIRTRLLQRPQAEPIGTRFLAWSPDGTTLAFPGSYSNGKNSILLYNVESNEVANSDVVQECLSSTAPPWARQVAWSPDGRVLAYGDRPILLLDASLRDVVGELPPDGRLPESSAYAAAWSPDGRHLAYCAIEHPTKSQSGTLSIWDFEHARKLLQPINVGWSHLAYAPDGSTLAVGYKLYDPHSGMLRHVLPAHKRGYVPDITSRSAWSHDGTLLATFLSSTVQVWGTQSGRLLHEVGTHRSLYSMSWSSAKTLAMWGAGISTWNLHEPYRPPQPAFGSVVGTEHMAWSLNSDNLIVLEWGASPLRIFDVTTRKELRKMDYTTLNWRKGLARAPDGKALAFGEDKEVKICDLKALQIEPPTVLLLTRIGALSWSPDGKTLAAACQDRKIYLIDMGLRQITGACEGHETQPISFGWTEDGKTLITGGESYQGDTGVCVWDVKSGKLLRTIADGGEVSPDGRLVAWRGQSVIRLRETEKGQVVCTMLSLRDSQYAAVSPDGHFRGSPGVEKELVYVVQTDQGQDTLTPAEFAQKYNWKNDPSKVGLKLESSPAAGPQPPLAKPAPVPTPAAADQPQPAESQP